MKKAILVLLIAIINFSAQAAEPDTQQLLADFRQAIESADEDMMRKLIIDSDKIEPKHADALASIYIDLLGKRLEKAIVSNQDKMKLVNKSRLNSMMRRSMAFMLANPDFILEKGELLSENGMQFMVAERKGKQSLMLKEVDGRTKFWPVRIQPTEDLIEFAQFLTEYKNTVENSSVENFPEGFDKLANTYVKGTKLEFKDQEVSVLKDGKEVPVKAVVMTHDEFMGKERISLNFMKVEDIEKCGKFQSKAFAIGLPRSKQELFDFKLLGINGSLMEMNNSTTVMDGKIELIKVDDNTYKGRIAAERDASNSIYGTFTAKLCNE